MMSKKAFELPWNVLIPLIILVALLMLYLTFSGTVHDSINNALKYIGDLFRFGG